MLDSWRIIGLNKIFEINKKGIDVYPPKPITTLGLFFLKILKILKRLVKKLKKFRKFLEISRV